MAKRNQEVKKRYAKRAEIMRKGLKSSTKFLADRNKLKLICEGQRTTFRELSVKIGHAPGWLSQRINESKRLNKLPEFTMSESDAKKIADVLEFKTDDFSSPGETFTTPIVCSLQAECKDFIATLPADRHHLVNAFMRFMRKANSSDLVGLQDFFQQPSKPTQLVSNRKADSSWLYNYILTRTRDVFYLELEDSLLTPDNASLQEALTSITGSSRHKRASMSKEAAANFDVSKDIERRLNEYLRNAIGDSLEDAWESARDCILDDCVKILRQYECSIPEAVTIVNNIKSMTKGAGNKN